MSLRTSPKSPNKPHPTRFWLRIQSDLFRARGWYPPRLGNTFSDAQTRPLSGFCRIKVILSICQPNRRRGELRFKMDWFTIFGIKTEIGFLIYVMIFSVIPNALGTGNTISQNITELQYKLFHNDESLDINKIEK